MPATVLGCGSENMGTLQARINAWTPVIFDEENNTNPMHFKTAHMSPSFGYHIVEVKLGWYACYMKTASNKIFKWLKNEITEIALHPSVGRIRDFYVHIGQLYVTNEDNRLFAHGVRDSKYIPWHTFATDYPDMKEVDVTQLTKVVSGKIEFVSRYNGGYIIISKNEASLDTTKILNREKFIDLEIIV